jgi:predicted ester cyclase
MLGAEQRVAIVEEHVRLENAHDFPGCIGKFHRARYEVMADGEVYDGPDRVNQFLSENRKAFPDFVFVSSRVSPTPDAVVVEGRFTGTHQGVWRGLPATGRRVDFPMCIIFNFEGDDMVSEVLYFDLGTALHQLGVAFDPNGVAFKIVTVLTHPITIIKAAVRTVWVKLTRRKP